MNKYKKGKPIPTERKVAFTLVVAWGLVFWLIYGAQGVEHSFNGDYEKAFVYIGCAFGQLVIILTQALRALTNDDSEVQS